MSQEIEAFLCPCCGMHAPLDRLYTEEPFELLQFRKTLGGKKKLTEAEREARKGEPFRRGSAHGTLNYEKAELTDEVREQFRIRIGEIAERMGE